MYKILLEELLEEVLVLNPSAGALGFHQSSAAVGRPWQPPSSPPPPSMASSGHGGPPPRPGLGASTTTYTKAPKPLFRRATTWPAFLSPKPPSMPLVVGEEERERESEREDAELIQRRRSLARTLAAGAGTDQVRAWARLGAWTRVTDGYAGYQWPAKE